MMKIKLNFKKKVIISGILIAFIPLILSYGIFINDKLSTIDGRIRNNLKSTAINISENETIKKFLYNKEQNKEIQDYSESLISVIEDIDIIVICDMNGEKYSHLDRSQIGEIFVNPDKESVLKNGDSYYSLMEGSMGKTLRWFQPIMYNDEQVGFVMVGKYYSDIMSINSHTKRSYVYLFITTIIISVIGSSIFAAKIKKDILDMEPEEIATLYNQKKIILNSVQNGIIALDKNNTITEMNKSCYELFNDFSSDKLIEKLKTYIDAKKSLKMKEILVENQKVFVNLDPIIESNKYLGVVIILSNRESIQKIAREITGVDEVIKNLRVNVHEFKNNMHVILGLIQLEQYDQAKEYILKLQKIEEDNENEFFEIDDYYVRALLLSRKLIAKERKVEFVLTEDSVLNSDHGLIDSDDIITILGNLIENAFEACVLSNDSYKRVEVSIYEDDEKIEIQVTDNGLKIDNEIRENMFEEGISSKGEGRGTGLSLVFNRVELYDGIIYVKQYEKIKTFNVVILKGEKNI